jgi:NadR type nicotinamide-nucleotide adenylyltransferase
VILGPESSGKTALATALAAQLNTCQVPEYAREYLELSGGSYNFADLSIIAVGQSASEETQALKAVKYLICDTNNYIIKVWSEVKYGTCDPIILQLIAATQCDLYIITTPDIEWEPDPLREHPGTDIRQQLFLMYKDIAINSGVPFCIVSGSRETRMIQALHAIRAHLG